MDDMQISCGLSHLFYNKPDTADQKELSKLFQSFKPTTLKIGKLIEHVTSGKAFTVSHFKGKSRKRQYYVSSQLLALDFDQGVSVTQIAADPFVQKYSFLVYPTPSSTESAPRCRVLFCLSEPVLNGDHWEALQLGLLMHFEAWHPDLKCKDLARIYFGSDKPGCAIFPNHLPLAVAGGLTFPQAFNFEQQARAKTRFTGSDSKGRHSGKTDVPDDLVDELISRLGVDLGDADSDGFVKKAVRCPFVKHQHDPEHPAAYWNVERKFLFCHKCGTPYNANATAEALGINTGSYYVRPPKFEPFPKPDLKGAVTIEKNFITAEDLVGDEDILLQSDIGTGKTSAVIPLFGGKRVLAITYRKTLATYESRRLGTVDYAELKDNQLLEVSKLSIVLQALHKLRRSGTTLPPYDILFLDDVDLLLSQFAGQGFSSGPAQMNAYTTLCAFLKESKKIIACDIGISPVTQSWLQDLRPDLKTIVNTFVRPRGKLTVYAHKEQALEDIINLVRCQEGPVAVAVNLPVQAKTYEAYFRQQLSGFTIRTIVGKKALSRQDQEFITHLEQSVRDCDLFIYSPSVLSAIDVKATIRAACGFFSAGPLTASQCHQMLGRWRNPQETLVYIGARESKRETDAHVIYHNYYEKADRNAHSGKIKHQGINHAPNEYRELHEFMSEMKAYANGSHNHFFHHFMTLAAGYSETIQNLSKPIDSKQKLDRAKQKAETDTRNRVLGAKAIDPNEFETLKATGQSLEEAGYGLTRWEIEELTGVTITREIYDLLEDPKQQEKFRNLRDVLFASDLDLDERARQDARSPIMNRSAVKDKCIVLRELFSLLFDQPKPDPTVELTEDKIAQVMRRFEDAHGHALVTLFGRRIDHVNSPVPKLRWVLNLMLLMLVKKEKMEKGVTHRVYRVDAQDWDWLEGLASTSWEHYLKNQ